MAERRTVNALVRGSSPRGRANSSPLLGWELPPDYRLLGSPPFAAAGGELFSLNDLYLSFISENDFFHVCL